jgi:hypothetical protein
MSHDLGQLPAEPAYPHWPTDCGELDAVANLSPMALADLGVSAERAHSGMLDMNAMAIDAVVFIDSGVTDVSAIVQAASANAEVVMLDPLSDGLAQIAAHLVKRPGIRAITLLAADCADGFRLGNTSLTQQKLLSRRGPELEAIRRALHGRVEIKCVMIENGARCRTCVMALLAEAIGAELVE